ncbi:MAG: PcfB family protein [Oscillospiraceae bacterium]|nr:PcfB family protein [Oscillospiraceae bacterium]
MDASTEVADLVVKESVQVAEGALKIAGSSLKNIAALLLALAKQDAKVVGKTTAKRLARDPNAAIVVQIPEADKSRFRRLAKKFGVLYFIAQKKGNQSGVINVVSNENYAAQLNAIMQELGYPLPEKPVETAKKATPRTQSERSSPERRNGSTPRTGTQTSDAPEKPSVRKRLEALKQASDKMKNGPEREKEHTR